MSSSVTTSPFLQSVHHQDQEQVEDEDLKNLFVPKPLADDNPATSMPHIPSVSAWAVLGESTTMPEGTPQCRGYDFSSTPSTTTSTPPGKEEDEQQEVNHFTGIVNSWLTMGFQATNLGLAVQQINEMRSWRLSHVPYQEGIEDPILESIEIRKHIRARIFLAYTSNQISCGQRETIKFLIQNKMIDVIITTAGGIEEDIMKCFQPTFMGDFKLLGKDLRKKGINRIGNLLVPNKNYCIFEEWMEPIIQQMHNEQDHGMKQYIAQQQKQQREQEEAASKNNNTKKNIYSSSTTTTNEEMDPFNDDYIWTPSKIIHRLGKEINHPDSVLYWAAQHNIPIFCPALTDGSIGDMFYFHSYKRPGFIIDINQDIRKLNDLAVHSHCTGQIILGGGVVKHHTCNANLMRNGADYSIYINTAGEFDGSDSGASPEEAISWGKIRLTAKPVKIMSDATLVFPMLVAATFAKNINQWKEDTKHCVCWVNDLPSSMTDSTT